MTKLFHSQHQAPLKVQRSFYPEGDEVCHSVILHTAGGMVGGDRLSYDIHLQPQSHALITTPAASKLYRSNGLEVQQTLTMQVETGACLEWFPLETIVFDGAKYRQDLRVELAENAHWVGWEMTRFGRSARGEKYVKGEWRSHTEIWRNGKPLWIDRQQLSPSLEQWESSHGLAGNPVVASFVWIGQTFDTEIVQKARQCYAFADGEMGVTRLPLGLLCRYRGTKSQVARKWFVSVWNLLRLEVLKRPASVPRVW